MLNLEASKVIARTAHFGQFDKCGVPYIEHVMAVSSGLSLFHEEIQIAGMLHDIVEDTPWTLSDLRTVGFSARTVEAVDAVTNRPGVSYESQMARITVNPDAVLIKIADNAHNSIPDRRSAIPDEKTRIRLERKYTKARDILWAVTPIAQIEAILDKVNPHLKEEIGTRPTM